MRINILTVAFLSCLAISCNNNTQPESSEDKGKVNEYQGEKYQNKAHELVFEMIEKVGDYKTLIKKKDVIYTFTYQTPDGKTNISTEKYIFDGELSYGLYHQHDRIFPDLEGPIEQGYDGNEFWLKHNGQIINDSIRLKKVAFNRPTNFYWFTMMQKLEDPGLVYEYVKEETIDKVTYDVVKVSFESKDNLPTDVYQLYINRDTKLVDQFLFTVVALGRTAPLLLKLEYENIQGLLLPTKRKYKKSNWEAKPTSEPWILVSWSNIKFNNNLSKMDFKK